jgi:hypothetical protein
MVEMEFVETMVVDEILSDSVLSGTDSSTQTNKHSVDGPSTSKNKLLTLCTP